MDHRMRATLAQLLAMLNDASLWKPEAMSEEAAASAAAVSFEGICTDSRHITPGCLFVALRGEHFDAHDFLEQAAAAGAAAVLVEKLPPGWTLPAIAVPDTLVALGEIAAWWRCGVTIPVIGVTGSNGKTTVKEMLASILAAAFGEDGRLATRGNLNNEIGVPLTLFRLNEGHRAAVIEMGMNHPGEIARLAAIAQPTVALVNNAQREHQEFMHTVEAVAQENGAVLAGLPAGGVAVFPHGDAFSMLWLELAGTHRVVTFGLSRDADVSCTWRANDFGSDLFVTLGKADGARQFHVAVRAAGEHNVRNALAAIACAWAAGIAVEAIGEGLAAFTPVSGRLQKKRADAAHGGGIVIDDSYNANPDSVRAAIDVLAQAASPRILVLGDMGEVGENGPEFHQEIGDYAASKGVGEVFVTGELARHVGGANVRHFELFDDLLAALDARLAGQSDATVLIKGSRFMKMERAVQHLIGSQHSNKEAH